MKRLAIIPARSGSKGLKNKNILLLNGKPLLSYTIEAAVKCMMFDKIIVSSDSDYYLDIASKYDVVCDKRSDELSKDNISSYLVIKDILNREKEKYDYFVLLQPTSPLRDSKILSEAIDLFDKNMNKFSSLVSVTLAHKPSCLIREIDDDLSLKNYVFDAKDFRRQKYAEYETNGAIFISCIDDYLKSGSFFGDRAMAFIMDKMHSIEIDNRLDFEMLLILMNNLEKYQITEDNVRLRINEKKFNTRGLLTLIGNSIIDKWNIKKLGVYRVNNFGVNASCASMIKKYLFNRKFDTLGDYVLLHFGTNEMIFTDNIYDIVRDINDLILEIKKYKVKKIYFLGIISVNGRCDRDNDKIFEYNKVLEKEIDCDIFIKTDELNNKYGMLDLCYTDDGLHLNKLGYRKLKEIVEKVIE